MAVSALEAALRIALRRCSRHASARPRGMHAWHAACWHPLASGGAGRACRRTRMIRSATIEPASAPACDGDEPSLRTVVVDSYAEAAALVTGLVADGVHFTCEGRPAGGWAFSVPDPEPGMLDALLVAASRAAMRPGAIAPVAVASR
jgi:hypothetical protein